MKSMFKIGIAYMCLALVVTSGAFSDRAFAKEGRASEKVSADSDQEQLAADYRARRAAGDTAQAHEYRSCRDSVRCGYWGYGGYGPGWSRGPRGWFYGGGASPGWSRGHWRGSDIPTTRYNRSSSR